MEALQQKFSSDQPLEKKANEANKTKKTKKGKKGETKTDGPDDEEETKAWPRAWQPPSYT
jgi:hypothetical protein